LLSNLVVRRSPFQLRSSKVLSLRQMIEVFFGIDII